MNSNAPHNSGFSSIIKEVEKFTVERSSSTTLRFILNEKTGDIVDRVPLFSYAKHRFFELHRNEVAFNVTGPVIEKHYSNSVHPFKVLISYDAKLSPDKSPERLVRQICSFENPLEAVNAKLKERLSEYIFSIPDFVINFNTYKSNLQEIVQEEGKKMGLTLFVYVNSSIVQTPGINDDEFIRLEHLVSVKTKDGQAVDIKHDLALTLGDWLKRSLSKIPDIKAWARQKLDQFTGNAIIEKNYSEVLTSLPESLIKIPMQLACQQVGYEMKHLISGPGIDREKFYFETADPEHDPNNTEYVTKEPRVKIALNTVVNGRLDLQHSKTKDALKPGHDILVSMRKIVIESTRDFVNDKTPEMCFLNIDQIEKDYVKYVRAQLEKEYAFNELTLLVKFLETDLAKRFRLLQERPYKVEVNGDYGKRRYEFWFRVESVDSGGWFRFLANNYADTEEELAAIGRLLKSGFSNALRSVSEVGSNLIIREFENIKIRIRNEFGVSIRLHDIVADLSEDDILRIKMDTIAREKKLEATIKLEEFEIIRLTQLIQDYNTLARAGESDKVLKSISDKIEIQRNNLIGGSNKLESPVIDSGLLLPQDLTTDAKNARDDKTNADE